MNGRTSRASALAMLVTTAPGCASPPPQTAPQTPAQPQASEPEAPATTETADPIQTFEALEARLLEGSRRAEFTLTAKGAVEVSIRGELVLDADAIQLRANGTFAGAPTEIQLRTEGDRLKGHSPGGTIDIPRPPHLREAIVVGLTRMGLLHNIAVLHGGRPPDHAEHGVRDWVQVDDLRRDDPVDAGFDPAPELPPDPLSMDITVSGHPAGQATLWLDPDTGLPLQRHQVVQFPEGTMQVRETYTFD